MAYPSCAENAITSSPTNLMGLYQETCLLVIQTSVRSDDRMFHYWANVQTAVFNHELIMRCDC